MENNSKDFYKNNPAATPLNQTHDVYGPASKSSMTVISTVLAVILLLLIGLSVAFAKYYLLYVFVPIFIVFIISFIVSYISEKNNKKPPMECDHTETIFKEHEE